ncbi:SPOSA6832_01204, partial [Sporobolomyces salmonicolor]
IRHRHCSSSRPSRRARIQAVLDPLRSSTPSRPPAVHRSVRARGAAAHEGCGRSPTSRCGCLDTPPPPPPPPPHTAPPTPTPPPPPPPQDTTEVVISPPLPGLPPLHTHPFDLPRVPFSTHRFVRRLEDADVPRGMATELMKATRNLLLREEERVRADLLSRQDLENEAYLFSAALNELRTGSQVRSRNDSITLKSLTASLQREADAVEQKMKEDMQRLHSDIQLEMNARKEETGSELQGLEMKIMDLNSKFTILLGEVRTEIEATKWISTRRVMTAIVIVVVSVVAYFSSSSSSKNAPPPPPPSIEELGVKPEGEEAEVGTGGGWSFWSSSPAANGAVIGANGKRVGDEE